MTLEGPKIALQIRILESPLFLLYVYKKDRKKPTPFSIKALEELVCKEFFTCTIGHEKL
jgi:hypothetical protein